MNIEPDVGPSVLGSEPASGLVHRTHGGVRILLHLDDLECAEVRYNSTNSHTDELERFLVKIVRRAEGKVQGTKWAASGGEAVGEMTLPIPEAWRTLPKGAQLALEQQWAGLAAGGLPCGAVVLGAQENVLGEGRNHAYDRAVGHDSLQHNPLQHTRLAHAEFNAMAHVPTEVDHSTLTLWSTQHPCAMCAAAIRFVGIGRVYYVADDPSDHSPPEAIRETRGDVPYEPLGDPLWWTIANLLFLYNSARQEGENARNLRTNRTRYPDLVRLTLELAERDRLGLPARAGEGLPFALQSYLDLIARVAERVRSETLFR